MGPSRRTRPIVAIDGPAGAGKSTVARRLADVLGFLLVDTGAMYRAVALAALGVGLAPSDADRVGGLARSLIVRRALSFTRDPPQAARVTIDGQDVTEAIRTPEVGMAASTVSAHPAVREALVDLQRQAGSGGGVVLEGRDIGTVIFPDAEIKFFLTATPEVRARRRFDELSAKGVATTLDRTLKEVLARDEQDTTRPVAPLRQAPDAIVIDDSHMGIEQTVSLMAQRVRSRGPT